LIARFTDFASHVGLEDRDPFWKVNDYVNVALSRQ
jgi:hypothetical protein